MTDFDETLFSDDPRLYRATDAAVDRLLAAEARKRRAEAPDGADRIDDAELHVERHGAGREPAGPSVRSCAGAAGWAPTATATRTSRRKSLPRPSASRQVTLLHGYEAVANRLMQTVAAPGQARRAPCPCARGSPRPRRR